jgi:hypothetical protein
VFEGNANKSILLLDFLVMAFLEEAGKLFNSLAATIAAIFSLSDCFLSVQTATSSMEICFFDFLTTSRGNSSS